ncbi:MAG: polysaccharide deacetylase family protein [Bacteroidia bacterium]|nr:polysaccharide deacetylase family protein [Bacteroidia bacterium]
MYSPVLIYCPLPTERHHYVFNLIFKDILGIDYNYSNDLSSSHINYSNQNSSQINITPHGLLEESTIRSSILNEVNFERWKDTSIFFKTNTDNIPFDIFSATFFLVTRYEEYLNFKPDNHNRFPATESVLYKNGLLETPIVNQWVKLLKSELQAFYNLSFPIQKFRFRSTIDIDQAWKFKNKGFVRNALGMFRDLVNLNIPELVERYQVLSGKQSDPYYNFEWQNSIHDRYNVDVTYFILLGNYGKFDKNISINNGHFIRLIKYLFSNPRNKIGIHPSYASNDDKSVLKNEYASLCEIVNNDLEISRQHFLIHSMPNTYQNLISLGINEDHTMGYSTHMGFRAGIASSFFWFDLENNKPTNLKLVPFCVMDITPMFYRKESPDQAIVSINKIIESVSDVGGLFVSLWHNDSLSETDRWVGWRKVYANTIKKLNDVNSGKSNSYE